MKKLRGLALWGGLFVVAVSLAIGLSLFALRVRAAVDAGRQKANVVPLVIGQAAAGPLLVELQSSGTPTAYPLTQSECPVLGDSDAPKPTPLPPTVDIPGLTYRDCCGVLRWVPAAQSASPVDPGSVAGPTPEATPSCH